MLTMTFELQTDDKICLVKFYFQSNESITAAIRKFCTSKNIKRKENAPSYVKVERMIHTFLETGNVNVQKSSSKRRSSEDIEQVRENIEKNPSSSCRSLASRLGSMSKSKVHNVLKSDLKMTPFKMQNCRMLSDKSIEERMVFCEMFVEKSRHDAFLENILFSDEAVFDLNPIINKQNCRIWSSSKPPAACFKTTSFPKKQMVWFGFTKHFHVGPYFFESNVTSETYCHMLKTFLIPQLKAKRKFSSTIFQQDGARPHTARQTLQFLNSQFLGRLLSRDTDFSWPGYSPDLSPLDFGFWGFLKSKVYGRNFETIDDLQLGICAAIDEIQQAFYASTIDSVVDRCHLCLQADGDIFET